ncbi:hypothetical protein J3R82DRAFT_11292 [Butyriboletus roseoflavus]|nr:hypothetical protein J3R82DRAFT_11292 [Butyriboletus roseoflavus]
MPEDGFFTGLSGKTLAFALVTPWNTDEKVAFQKTVYMTSHKASVITDVHSLEATVSLVETCKRWGMIDRMMEGVTTSFIDVGMI